MRNVTSTTPLWKGSSARQRFSENNSSERRCSCSSYTLEGKWCRTAAYRKFRNEQGCVTLQTLLHSGREVVQDSGLQQTTRPSADVYHQASDYFQKRAFVE